MATIAGIAQVVTRYMASLLTIFGPYLASLRDLTSFADGNAEEAVPNSNPHASQDQESLMDCSLTYFDDVAAIRVSLQLMQKRSGVPLLRFTSTFEVPPLPDPLRQ